MATALDIIEGSLRLIGALATGETPSSADSTDALTTMNQLIDSWSNDGYMVFERKREEFTLTALQASFTIGTGGNFNTSRPTTISEAGIIENDTELPVEIISQQEFSQIVNKDTQSNIPQRLYYEPEYPLGKINLWPVPSVANTLVLYSMKPLSQIATTGTTISLPPGYERALKYNLAVELAPEYGKPIDSIVAQIAMDSKNELQRTNYRPLYMRSDAFGMNRNKPWDYRTGD